MPVEDNFHPIFPQGKQELPLSKGGVRNMGEYPGPPFSPQQTISAAVLPRVRTPLVLHHSQC